MSNSIITYGEKKINTKDFVLFVALAFFLGNLKRDSLPEWFNRYLEEVIDVVLDVKPIGWAYLDLEEYFETNEKKIFFINLINGYIQNLNEKGIDRIEAHYINNLLHLEDIEKLDNNFYLEIKPIKECLQNIIFLLDDNKTAKPS
ncbi:hypothetical protein B0A78_13990 [Flavobacterium columnare NBRC 100251 = ATCC 23463]|uniref:hypothetical protein n=1 Tax=Flavobacterium columnare TaxID=996 RepID=UPI000BE7BDC2|nr:hypothetical protein [Flavobacterium columnare]PDS21684.1 hypothetical protein B0A78_13990 [Flavobacterium columnare NBRC 100251 = ATCC 23463]GEM59289.1 hypothetical protein FC1_25270 [Flavobacterium columnare NBRC 100251 = ATCC 23463]